MGLPEIGLEAIFRDANFLSAMGEYIKAVQGGSRETEGAGRSMTQSLAMVGGGVVVGALAAATAAISTISAACIASIPAVLDWAESLDSIGDVLGTNSDESAALSVAIEGVGGNIESITSQMAFLTKGLETAKGEEGNTAAAMNDLGIQFRDANGELLPSTQILSNVADVLGNMPDGLEKTRAMTQLFGKSGKDLSDVMTALANGGLAKAQEKAAQLGLTLGDETTDAAIMLGREFKTIQMAGKGLVITLGRQLLPVITPLVQRFSELAMQAMPKLREIITRVAQAVGDFVNKAVQYLPIVIGYFDQVVTFFSQNSYLIIGALGAIAVAVGVWAYTTMAAAIPAIVAMVTAAAPLIGVLLLVGAAVAAIAWAWQNNFLGMRDILTQFWTNTVQPALQDLWAWLQVNIPAALQTLANFWSTVLLPAIQTVGNWITGSLIPALQTIWGWLATNIPAAITTFLTFWNGVLLPALTAVWLWISTYIIPLFQALGNLFSVILTLAVQGFSSLWSSAFQPALDTTGGFLTGTLLPALGLMWDWIWVKLKPALEWAARFLEWTFVNALKALEGMIRSVIGWIDALARALANLVIPDALQPGSPTPFEIGLSGVRDAIRDVTGALTPLQMHLDRVGSSAALSSAPTPAAANVNNISNTWNMGGQTVNNGWDAATLRAFIINTISEALA